jgi:RNA polymerase sigma-70 factor (ECF subfamily)
MRAEVENAMELLRSRQPGNVERALELLQNTVFSFSMRVCGHQEDAEDTAQEVLLKSIPHLEKFENAKALGVWLYTVARNRCWMSRRRSKFAPQQHLSLDELMPDAAELDHLSALAARGPSPETTAIQAQDVERLKQAILQVPPQYRLVLVLHDIEELSTDEIAKVLGIKEGNVRARLHRARLFARKELARSDSKVAGEQQPDNRPAPGPNRRSRHCRQIFSNLSNYLDGVLDDSLCEELERHMAGCKPCEAFLANLQNTVAALRRAPGESMDATVAAQVRSRALNELTGQQHVS